MNVNDQANMSQSTSKQSQAVWKNCSLANNACSEHGVTKEIGDAVNTVVEDYLEHYTPVVASDIAQIIKKVNYCPAAQQWVVCTP